MEYNSLDVATEQSQDSSQENQIDILNLSINATLKSLIDCGVLIELDGGVGYNGITIPSGLSNERLEEMVNNNISNIILRGNLGDDISSILKV